jgi:hypothetical protein
MGNNSTKAAGKSSTKNTRAGRKTDEKKTTEQSVSGDGKSVVASPPWPLIPSLQ